METSSKSWNVGNGDLYMRTALRMVDPSSFLLTKLSLYPRPTIINLTNHAGHPVWWLWCWTWSVFTLRWKKATRYESMLNKISTPSNVHLFFWRERVWSLKMKNYTWTQWHCTTVNQVLLEPRGWWHLQHFGSWATLTQVSCKRSQWRVE